MSHHARLLALAAAGVLAVSALPTDRAQAAAAPVVVAVGSSGAAGPGWPFWIVGGGVLSLMIRAAVVYNTECRELTLEEAITGTSFLWPAWHQPVNRCGVPVRAVRPVRAAPVVGRY